MSRAMSKDERIRELLEAYNSGDKSVYDTLFSMIYDDLRGLAKSRMGKERSNHTLQPTAVVNELYVKLADSPLRNAKDSTGLRNICSRAMKQFLIDYARQHVTEKRGGDFVKVPLHDSVEAKAEKTVEYIDLYSALQILEKLDQRQYEIVLLKFFWGSTNEEIASICEVSVATVKNDLAAAKAWLGKTLKP